MRQASACPGRRSLVTALRTSGILALLLGGLTAACRADTLEARVTEVTDGDTIVVNIGDAQDPRLRVLRVRGIDCPEKDQPFAADAKALTGKHCLNRSVIVHVRDVDTAERLVSDITLEDGSDLGTVLLENGLAWCYPRHGTIDEVRKGAEAMARREKRGLWSDANPVRPWRWKPAADVKTADSVPAPALRATVTQVVDGDTYRVEDEDGTTHTIRLCGADCPEGGRPYSEAARRFASDLCLHKTVTLLVRSRDRYGRLVARVTLPEGDDLALSLIEAGLAWKHPGSADDDEALQEAEVAARTERRGLWVDPNPKAPWEK